MAFSVRRAMFYTASALLIVMFGLSSVMKLTPALNAATHAELKAKFHSFVHVPPVDLLKLEPDVYRTIVGVVELVSVACLICPHSQVQLLGNYVLLVIMMGALYTHVAVGDAASQLVPAAVCLALCLLRLYTCGKLKMKVKTS